MWKPARMSADEELVVSALAINVTIPEALRWTDARRGQTFRLDTLNVRMLPDGHRAARVGHRYRAVRGSRGPLNSAEDVRRRVTFDVEYIERQTFWLDMWIVLMTVPSVFGDRGTVR